MPRNEAQFAAQERENIPLDKAGLDYIRRRGIDAKKFRDEHDRIFGGKARPKARPKAVEPS